jgi:eukaryotic-like serine/threonine-protein kinase
MRAPRRTRAKRPSVSAAIGPGARIGRFQVGALRHEGGMSRLYDVHTARGHAPLLLKTPKLGPDHPLSCLVAFENETNILKRLHGPHVPKFVAAGDLRERPYLVLERIDGDVLAQAARRAPVSTAEVCDLGVRLCRAVQALHHQNVIHFDLNPANVRNRANGDMVLIDFGLAHHAALPDLHDSAFGEEEGTTPYIAPEQLHHVRTDSRSDIYAIGAILYQLATGQFPFGRPNLLSLKKRLVQPPWPPRCLNPDVPPWLQEIILRCLHVRPERRPPTAKQVAYLLAHPESVTVGAYGHRTRPAGLGQRTRWWLRSLFQKFDEEIPQKPYTRLTSSPHVLVALDLSHCSDALGEALRRAVRRLALSEPHSFFTCLSVVPREARAEQASSLDMERQVGMRSWAQPLRLAPQRMVFQVLPGDPAPTIVDYVRRHLVDQVILGARGSSVWRQHLGSVSAVVAAQATCTVIVVRTRRDRAPKRRRGKLG